MTQEMCDKVVDRCFFVFDSIPDQYRSQEMWQSCFWRSFLIVYCTHKYKTRRLCDEAVDGSLAALKFIPNWFVKSKMIRKELSTGLYAYENILYFNKDYGNVIFSCNEMGILYIDINNINLENNFDKDDPDTIILITFLAWNIKFEKRKAPKKW